MKVATDRELRARKDPGFCYICGAQWTSADRIEDEHIVPKSIFEPVHRQAQPLILRAHAGCNTRKSKWDEPVGQLFKLTTGTLPSDPKNHRIAVTRFVDGRSGEVVFGIREIDFQQTVAGWVMGFHTLLYREYCQSHMYPASLPWASFIVDPSQIETVDPLHIARVPTLRASRLAGAVDEILGYGGQTHYYCT